MSNRVAILKKVSLSGLADGWGDDCVIVVRPASYKQFKEYTQTKVEDMTEAEGIEMISNLVGEQFVSGKIMVLNDQNEMVLDSATKEDVENLSIEMLNVIFSAIMGTNYDPKAMPTAPTNNAKPSNSDDATATSSSEIE